MGRPPSKQAPAYQKVKGRDLASVKIAGKRHYLGKYDSAESWQEYHRLCAEHKAGTLDRPDPVRLKDMTLGLLVARFTAERVTPYYPDERSSEAKNIKHALDRVTALYGSTPLAKFGPRELKAVRDHMAGDQARTTANRNLGRVRQMLKWAVAEGFYPALSFVAIQAVEGIKAGRLGAREPKGVGPVPLPDVAATLPHLSPPVAAMVRLQVLTGMRPGEVRMLRWADLDTAGDVWVYRPTKDKNRWRGKARSVMVGPQAQALILPLRKANAESPLFSPLDAVEAGMAAARGYGATYSSSAYRNATMAGAKKAGVPHWHPNQLRHTAATEIRARFGLEAAQAVLGHARADTTQIYAERDQERARAVAREVG